MKIEHFAINVAAPRAVAAWYGEHLGMTAVVADNEPPFKHFLADSSGEVLLELYNNPPFRCLAARLLQFPAAAAKSLFVSDGLPSRPFTSSSIHPGGAVFTL